MNAVFWRYDFAGLGSHAPAGEYDDFIRGPRCRALANEPPRSALWAALGGAWPERTARDPPV